LTGLSIGQPGRSVRYLVVAGLALSVVLASGCDRVGSPVDQDKPQEQPPIAKKHLPLDGTIGAACYVDGLRSMLVQGHGLVVGLPGTGSRECPDSLRGQLQQEIAKRQHAARGDLDPEDIVPAADMLASLSTAVVKIYGRIPPGAAAGQRFDVFVEAVPNTQTVSLEGGRLFTADLRLYNPAISGGSKPLATASGQVFINPFRKPKADQRDGLVLKRRGSILDGGTNLRSRQLRLVLHQPSYALARTIERRINDRFALIGGQSDVKAAEAASAGTIQLHVPSQYADQMGHFLQLVQNLFIRSDASYLDIKARQLSTTIPQPDVNAEAISLAWEGIGQTILPVIAPLYDSSNRQAAFYSARAGCRLGDLPAIEVLSGFAGDTESVYRDQAITSLTYSRYALAGNVLARLLDSSNVRVRTLAFQALKQRNDPCIRHKRVGGDNFVLDSINQGDEPIIYATRSGQSSIGLLGRDMKIRPPVFYIHPDQSVTIRAGSGDDHLTIIRRTPKGASSQPIHCSLRLEDFIVLLGNRPAVDSEGKVSGLGLSYSHVVAILKEFCDSAAINAKFILQQPTGPVSRSADSGRPERDLD